MIEVMFSTININQISYFYDMSIILILLYRELKYLFAHRKGEFKG